MTFTELVTEIKDRLNLSSTESTTRIGRAINRKYRLVTSSIGLQLSRRTTVQQAVSIGVSTVTFSGVEKVISVMNRTTTPYRVLKEVTIDELREIQPYTTSDTPDRYAVHNQTADTIVIEINRIPQTAFTLYADVHTAIADLSGSNEPAFPESFHDILIEGVMSDELRKMEKPQLAQIASGEFQRILGDLRMWIAKSGYLDIYQGKKPDSMFNGIGSGSGSGTGSGATSYTQTGLITFDRDPLAPFAVTASSAKVPNLDADKLDGLDSTAFALTSTLSGYPLKAGAETISGAWAFTPTGPTVPTAAPATSTTQAASTAFVTTADNLKANLASPTFTGTPAAPTAAVGTNTTQIATTAFVLANASDILATQVFS